MAFKPIQIVINAKDNASAVFQRLQGEIKAAGLAIAAYFGVKAFAGGIQGAADFEAAMSRVKAATDGTAEEMQGLTKAAQDAGVNTKYTSVEAAGALENLAKAGLSAGDSIKALPAVLALAQAGDVELGTASEYVTKAVMGMGLAFEDAARVADVLALGANATNTSVEGLAQALSYAAPVANSLGMSLESTVAIIGKFADAGIDASRAGTALNSVLSQFADPASKFRQELGLAGIVTNDFDEALRQLAAKGPAGARAITAVGMVAGPALRALLNQGMGALDGLTEKLNNAKGSADAAAQTMSDNFAGSIKSWSSVWQSAVEALNTPVLPVLRQGIDELTASLRNAISDGTVAKFGAALATAFEQALKYFREFAANVNFDAVLLRFKVFASETQEVLERVGMYAKNAGHSVQLAWGVMTAGANGVLTVVYGIGLAFTSMAEVVMQGVIKLREGLATITFGELSEHFRLTVEDAKATAEMLGGVSQAFKEKAAASLQDTAAAAQIARDGWTGLTAEVERSQSVLQSAGQHLDSVQAGVEGVAAAAAKAQPVMQAKAQADLEAAQAVKQLRSEYDDLIKSGNLQAAASKLQEIDRIQRNVANSAEGVAQKAALIDQAYASLGLKTNEELTRMSDQAREAFERLAKDGSQPPHRIAEAWAVMAQRVIESNGGITPSWLKVEASVKGYEIAIDRAGKAVISTEQATLKATQRMAGGLDALAGSADRVGSALGKVGQSGPSSPSPNGGAKPSSRRAGNQEFGGLELGKDDQDRILGLRKSGDHLVAANELRKIKYQQDNERDEKDRNERSEENARRSQKAQASIAGLNTGGTDRDLLQEMFGKNPLQSVFPKGGVTFQMPTMPMPAAGMPASAAPGGSAMTRRLELVLNGREYGAVQTDEGGGSALERMLEDLQRAAQTAGGKF